MDDAHSELVLARMRLLGKRSVENRGTASGDAGAMVNGCRRNRDRERQGNEHKAGTETRTEHDTAHVVRLGECDANKTGQNKYPGGQMKRKRKGKHLPSKEKDRDDDALPFSNTPLRRQRGVAPMAMSRSRTCCGFGSGFVSMSAIMSFVGQ